jgi:L-malate glycosyltransferase
VRPERRRVLLVVPTFLPHDAVGNDVLGMAECFESAGYQTTILAQCVHPILEKRARCIDEESNATWKCPDDILIYHHAQYWQRGEELLEDTATKMVVKYHNVTPPGFFERYSDKLVQECQRGVELTGRIARHPRAWYWGDSSFNTGELIKAGAPPERCRVVPPIHRIEQELAGSPVDNRVLARYRDSTNILFVGGLRPHKGHLKAVEVFARFRGLSDRKSRLLLVGGSDPNLKRYEDDIRARAVQLGVEAEVDLAIGASPAQLRAAYLAATVFLCVSEHEGFCVPLIESMYFRLPIVAWATTAVKETCAGVGIVLEDFDAARLAESIAECVENPVLAQELACRGRSRYESSFLPAAIQRRLLDLLTEVEQSAPRGRLN